MNGLHLIQIPLRLREFTAWALARRFLAVPRGDGRGRPREPDPGYALHAALLGLLGKSALRPFAVPRKSRRERRGGNAAPSGIVPVLGYGRTDLEQIQALAGIASDEYRDLFDCERMRSRPLPRPWPAGLRLAFDLRACPVRRSAAGRPFRTNAGHPRRKTVVFAAAGGRGVEVDAFQLASARAEERGEPIPTRDQIYIRWLEERFATSAARPALALVSGSLRVRSYRSVRLLRRPRRGNGRSARWLTRPEVWFSGEAVVVDGSKIPALLSRGVGRHSGFGFGMLLLRPP